MKLEVIYYLCLKHFLVFIVQYFENKDKRMGNSCFKYKCCSHFGMYRLCEHAYMHILGLQNWNCMVCFTYYTVNIVFRVLHELHCIPPFSCPIVN